MQTLKNDFIVTSNRTLRCGINPAAVLTKANLCYRLFCVNCKYSNTLRSKHWWGRPKLPIFINAKYLQVKEHKIWSQDTVAKQMFISEYIQIVVTFNMGFGEGNSVHKNWLEEGFCFSNTPYPQKKKEKAWEHTNIETRQYLRLWNSPSLSECKENNDIAIITIKPADVAFI